MTLKNYAIKNTTLKNNTETINMIIIWWKKGIIKHSFDLNYKFGWIEIFDPDLK